MWVRQPVSGSYKVQSRCEGRDAIRIAGGCHPYRESIGWYLVRYYIQKGLATNMHNTFMYMKGDKNFIGGHMKA